MDFTDKAVFGQQMGETAAWAVECRRGEMTIVGEEGKGGGVGGCVGGGSEGKVFPELGK